MRYPQLITSVLHQNAMPVARFNLAEIVCSLDQTQSQFKKINKTLNVRRSQLADEVEANMVEGYRFIDQLLAQGTDLFAMGNSGLLLEINTLVLCGPHKQDRENYILHIEQNRQQFYDDPQGGIGSLMEWCEFHKHDNLWKRAAGLYIQIMSQPQLFIEGNHRSAILVVSFMLGREGYPPFVLTPGNAKELLDQSKEISELKKHSFGALIRTPKLRNKLATTLQRGLDRRHSL
jgi:prophage maintenance system killer protein